MRISLTMTTDTVTKKKEESSVKKLVCLLLSLMLSVACVSLATAEQTTLSFLVGDTQMLDWFTQTFPEYISGDNEDQITVGIEYQAEASNLLQAMAAAEEIPDMMCLALPQQMIDQGFFYDLSGLPAWDTLYPAVKDQTVDIKSGKNYFIPMGSGAMGLFYNTKIFEELGLSPATTWDGFVSNLEAIKAAYPDVAPFYMGGSESWMFGHLHEWSVMGDAKVRLGFAGYETALANGDLEALGWNIEPDGILATFCNDMLELQQKGLINANVVTATSNNQLEMFATGKAAVISNGLWAVGSMLSYNPDATEFIGFSTYPAFTDSMANMVGNPTEGYVALSASCKNMDAALKVLGDMFSEENLKSYAEFRGCIPTNPNVSADWSFLKDAVNDVLSTTKTGTFTNGLPGGFGGDDNGRLVQNIFVGKYADGVAYAQDFIQMWNQAYEASK